MAVRRGDRVAGGRGKPLASAVSVTAMPPGNQRSGLGVAVGERVGEVGEAAERRAVGRRELREPLRRLVVEDLDEVAGLEALDVARAEEGAGRAPPDVVADDRVAGDADERELAVGDAC